jgi:hypothetical protein
MVFDEGGDNMTTNPLYADVDQAADHIDDWNNGLGDFLDGKRINGPDETLEQVVDQLRDRMTDWANYLRTLKA